MDRPTWYPFRDAAMRADTDALTTPRIDEPGAAPIERRDRVVGERGVVAHAEPPIERRRFSLGATFLGWCVAAFITLVLSAALVTALGISAVGEATSDTLTATDVQQFSLMNLAGYVLIAFLAYVVGGYAAGRIALWDGVKHGMLTVAWAVLFAIVAIVGTLYAADLFDVSTFAYVPTDVDVGSLGAYGILAIVLTLAAMLGGAALGGKIGERYHERVHGLSGSRRGTWGTRGRPL